MIVTEENKNDSFKSDVVESIDKSRLFNADEDDIHLEIESDLSLSIDAFDIVRDMKAISSPVDLLMLTG